MLIKSVEPDHAEVAAAVKEQLRFAAEEDTSAAAASSLNRYRRRKTYRRQCKMSSSKKIEGERGHISQSWMENTNMSVSPVYKL